jgi:hypothetical protein
VVDHRVGRLQNERDRSRHSRSPPSSHPSSLLGR